MRLDTTNPNRMIALGILIFSLIAVVVGIVNGVGQNSAARSAEKRALEAAAAGGGSQAIASILGTGGIKKDHLLLIPLHGAISSEPEQGGFLNNDSMAMTARKALDAAVKDDSVKGVLLAIDSPGGTVGMSQELNAAVRRVSQVKPVVVSMGDVAASGGYYTACAADKIVANPGTLTASIGVIISTLNLKGLLTDKLGVKALTVKSGKFKDILSPYREANPEEVALIQHVIDESYRDFLNAVITGRTRFLTSPAEKTARAAAITAVADGRIVLGSDAKKVGLVDELGDLYAAQMMLNQMARERFKLRGQKELPLQEYSQANQIFSLLGLASIDLHPLMQLAQAFRGGLHSTGLGMDSMMPFSMRHPNQPLWILE